MLLRSLSVSCFLCFSFFLNAQEVKYNSLLRMYTQRLDTVNQFVRQRDSAAANSIFKANSEFYQRLLELDTATAKPLLTENIEAMGLLLQLVKSDTSSERTIAGSIHSFRQNLQWYEQQFPATGLESCPQCFLVRKVRITVLRRVNDGRLDTVKCAIIDFRKILLNNTSVKGGNAVSFPCPEYERTLSTGPKYEFIVSHDGKKEVFEKSVDIGTALTDIQRISLILPKQQ